jgi:hypothetical protein
MGFSDERKKCVMNWNKMINIASFARTELWDDSVLSIDDMEDTDGGNKHWESSGCRVEVNWYWNIEKT